MQLSPANLESLKYPPKLSLGFKVFIGVIVPLMLFIVNVDFFLSLRASLYGKENQATVLKKNHYDTAYRDAHGHNRTWPTYEVDVSTDPHRWPLKVELSKSDWENIQVGQIIRIKTYAGSVIAKDSSYPGTSTFVVSVVFVLGVLLGGPCLIRNYQSITRGRFGADRGSRDVE